VQQNNEVSECITAKPRKSYTVALHHYILDQKCFLKSIKKANINTIDFFSASEFISALNFTRWRFVEKKLHLNAFVSYNRNRHNNQENFLLKDCH